MVGGFILAGAGARDPLQLPTIRRRIIDVLDDSAVFRRKDPFITMTKKHYSQFDYVHIDASDMKIIQTRTHRTLTALGYREYGIIPTRQPNAVDPQYCSVYVSRAGHTILVQQVPGRKTTLRVCAQTADEVKDVDLEFQSEMGARNYCEDAGLDFGSHVMS